MHYLEDVIELLEYLPDEVRTKCEELQQLDLQYQEKVEKLRTDSREFFDIMPTLSQAECERRNREFHKGHQEVRDIADEKVQLTEYLQSVLEKYHERVLKDLLEFKAELESDNPAEVQMIEQEYIQAVTNPRKQSSDGTRGLLSLNDDELDQKPSTSSAIPQMNEEALTPLSGHLNGFGNEGESTPKSHFQQRMKQQACEDFKIPSTFRRPSQSLDTGRAMAPPKAYDEDIFDAQISPPIKRPKPAPPPRQLAVVGSSQSRKSSRDTSPRSSISSSSPRSTSPAVAHSSKFPFLPPRHPTMDSSQPSTSSAHGTPHFRTTHQHQQQDPESAARQTAIMRMPSFAGAQASRHGRSIKLTKKVKQMFDGSRPQHGPSTSSNRPQARKRRRRTQDEEAQLEDIDEEEDYEEEEEEVQDEEDEADNRLWCYCKQGSSGAMVACDGENCPYEWFHWECIGITQPPKGSWFCPTCSMKMNAATQQRSRSASTDQQQSTR